MSGRYGLRHLALALMAHATFACGDAAAPGEARVSGQDTAALADMASADGAGDAAGGGDGSDGPRGDSGAQADSATAVDIDAIDAVVATGDTAGDGAPGVHDASDANDAAIGPCDSAALDAIECPDAVSATGDAIADAADVSPVDAVVSAPECLVAADCEAQTLAGPCRVWACDKGVCALSALLAGTPCAATTGCVQKSCDASGHCSAVVALPCPATACAIGACDLGSGVCVPTPSAPGAPCNDGDLCTSQDGCDGAGACKAGPTVACPAGACQSAACAPALGCKAPLPLPAGVTCSDGDACTPVDGCDGKGQCQPGPVLTCPNGQVCALGACPSPGLGCDVTACDDGNACTIEGCAVGGACLHIAAKGAPCQDGDPCTLSDVCSEGACLAGPAKSCTGDGPCLQTACAPASGDCLSVPLPGACTPADACALTGSCTGGACVTTSGKVCDDGDPCTADSCGAGLCQHPPLPAGQPCGEGLSCLSAAASCACALGTFIAPHEGEDWLRAVAAAPSGGFIAVGDSDAPGSARGLLLRVHGGNAVQLQRRYGKPGAVSFVGVIADPSGDVRVGATLGQQHAAVLRLDSLGNPLAQHLVKPFATAEALAAVGTDGALLLCADAFEPDANAHLLRIATTGKLVWQASVAPSKGLAARAHSLVLLDGVAVAAGQDLAVTGEPTPQPWLRSFDLATGAISAATTLTLPKGSVVLATGASSGAVTLSGTVLNATGAFSARWTAELPWPGDGAATKSKVEPDGGAFAGIATAAGARFVVGWRAVKGGQATVRRLPTSVDAGWTLHLEAPTQQSLHAVTALPDGTLVAVGSRQAKDGSAALWLRFTTGGAQTCP